MFKSRMDFSSFNSIIILYLLFLVKQCLMFPIQKSVKNLQSTLTVNQGIESRNTNDTCTAYRELKLGRVLSNDELGVNSLVVLADEESERGSESLQEGKASRLNVGLCVQ